jgi:hypothetical protein
MDVAEWQKRLTDTFAEKGVVARNLASGISQEQAYKEYILKAFHGYDVLMECFFSFYLDTLSVATRQLHEEESLRSDEAYRTIHLIHVTNFKSLRAADNTFLSGYPLDAVTLLRDLKDRAVFLSAVGQGLSSIHDLCRILPEDDDENGYTEERLNAARRARMEEERRVMNLMLRSTSGFSGETLSELQRWERLFNFEVHGSWLTRAYMAKEIKEYAGLSLWPLPEQGTAAMYMCRACEVGWMLMRTLPLLQVRAKAFGEEWSHKWIVLDKSFRYDMECFGETGKQIAYAVIELLDKKFPFNPDMFYKAKA